MGAKGLVTLAETSFKFLIFSNGEITLDSVAAMATPPLRGAQMTFDFWLPR